MSVHLGIVEPHAFWSFDIGDESAQVSAVISQLRTVRKCYLECLSSCHADPAAPSITRFCSYGRRCYRLLRLPHCGPSAKQSRRCQTGQLITEGD